jgi:hypothetical protein
MRRANIAELPTMAKITRLKPVPRGVTISMVALKTRFYGIYARLSSPASALAPLLVGSTQEGFRPTSATEQAMEDIRMRDAKLAADKRAREAAQGQRSAEGGSAQSPQAKQQARSGARGKKTPEQAGGSGRTPSGAINRMQVIDDIEAAEIQSAEQRRASKRAKAKVAKG